MRPKSRWKTSHTWYVLLLSTDYRIKNCKHYFNWAQTVIMRLKGNSYEKWRWNWYMSQITTKIRIWRLFIKLHNKYFLKTLKTQTGLLSFLLKNLKPRYLKPNSTALVNTAQNDLSQLTSILWQQRRAIHTLQSPSPQADASQNVSICT